MLLVLGGSHDSSSTVLRELCFHSVSSISDWSFIGPCRHTADSERSQRSRATVASRNVRNGHQIYCVRFLMRA